jgi:tryptophan 2,3-dioxygenase
MQAVGSYDAMKIRAAMEGLLYMAKCKEACEVIRQARSTFDVLETLSNSEFSGIAKQLMAV